MVSNQSSLCIVRTYIISHEDPIFYSTAHFYIGKEEASADGGVNPSETKHFKQYLTRLGHDLKGLYLSLAKASSLPGEYASLLDYHTCYMLLSEIDLRNNSRIQLLQFDFCLENGEGRKTQETVIRWFSSICESVASDSLIIEVRGLSKGICSRIQDTLLTLYTRIHKFSVHLYRMGWRRQEILTEEEMRKVFSLLYGTGVVAKENTWHYRDEAVCHQFPTSYPLYLSLSCLASLSFPLTKYYYLTPTSSHKQVSP